MNDQDDNEDRDQTEPADWAPMIYFEAEMRPVVPPEVRIRKPSGNGADGYHLDSLIESIIKRPQEFFGEIQSGRDLVLFIEGVCSATHPRDGGLGEFVNRRFGQPPTAKCTMTLLKEFAHQPLADACVAIERLLQEWKTKKAAG